MSSPPPIRVGIIGLAQTSATGWAASAHLPNFLTAAGRERFQIVALCNTSVASAQAAIRAFGLDPATTRAYGSPADLAADPDVDFVLCSVRVDKHLPTTLPSIEAGKDVYIEWPIAANPAEIQRVVDAAKKAAAAAPAPPTIFVGLQHRYAPPLVKVKELLAAGAIGTLRNLRVNCYGGFFNPGCWPLPLKYFAEGPVGGNPMTINVPHLVDNVQFAVGEFIPDTVHTHYQIQEPDVPIVKSFGSDEVVETVRTDVPDIFNVHGLVSSPASQRPVTVTVHYQSGYPFPDTPAGEWTFTGSKGTIRLVDPSGLALMDDTGPTRVTIQLHRDGATGDAAVEDVAWEYSALEKEVPPPARAIQALLYQYADAKRGVSAEDVRQTKDWPSLASAAARAAQVNGWLSTFKG
ncbi:NAD(P)-binding domain protein [Niveomyces insectorum RCEF 264]|uniref:NAD(P)-binding domain protein n=1 Tax=Niveomyces insectorum RCEF 264 TaxID=1081102 RepID=A0A167VM52_9HYPO|nr:NAD(P)-binding domain protein [Niveomyces insectorum RCEF 264]